MRSYLEILSPECGRDLASFYIYLPASEDGAYYTRYRFMYEVNPKKPELTYENGCNDAANRRFYRIRTADLVRREGETFSTVYRVLSGGEIGFAIKEEGAGDFVGGFHGDELLSAVSLIVDGREMSLCKPYFGAFENFSFFEESYICRCNTPDENIIRHVQTYTREGDRLLLDQNIEWIADARKLHSGFAPMLTAQRVNPDKTEEILSDTVAFYSAEDELLATFDTTPFGNGQDGGYHQAGKATRARAWGKSGLSMEAGYTVRDGSVPDEQISAKLWIRSSDNKAYFEITGGTTPKKGTAWRSNIFYRVTYETK